MLSTDRIPYVCSCGGVTYAPPGKVAVTCTKCNHIDLSTELARDRWKTVAEVRLSQRPDPVAPARRPIRAGMVALVAVAALVEAVVLWVLA